MHAPMLILHVGPGGAYAFSCSAPHIYAVVLEQAALVAGSRVLCVGSGTGYFCAVAAELVSMFFFPICDE